MEKLSVVDLGNIGEPTAAVANNVLDKIAGALGWVVRPKGIKPAILKANESIIEEIAGRQDIPLVERAVLVNNYNKLVREYKNQTDVLQGAMHYLETDIVPDRVSDEWLTFFFDKVKDVTETYMKDIWARILAGEFNAPNTYTKRFLHILSIMDSNMAVTFQKIRSSCFYKPPYLLTFIYRNDNDAIKNAEAYKKLGLTFRDLRELNSLGLIEYREPNFFRLRNSNHAPLYYGEKTIWLTDGNNLIETGNVSLTEVGKQLCRLTEPAYDDRILEICMESWRKLGYDPVIDCSGL